MIVVYSLITLVLMVPLAGELAGGRKQPHKKETNSNRL
jgi:hypothetical protein